MSISIKRSIEWSVAYKITESTAVTHSIFKTREKARAHKRGMEKLLGSMNKTNHKLWLERRETVYHHESGKNSMTIVNVSKIR